MSMRIRQDRKRQSETQRVHEDWGVEQRQYRKRQEDSEYVKKEREHKRESEKVQLV